MKTIRAAAAVGLRSLTILAGLAVAASAGAAQVAPYFYGWAFGDTSYKAS